MHESTDTTKSEGTEATEGKGTEANEGKDTRATESKGTEANEGKDTRATESKGMWRQSMQRRRAETYPYVPVYSVPSMAEAKQSARTKQAQSKGHTGVIAFPRVPMGAGKNRTSAVA